MKKLTLNKAAQEAKVAKTTLLDAIKKGRLTAPKNDRGAYEIDPAELFRVFTRPDENQTEKPEPTSQENQIAASILEVKLQAIQDRWDDAQKTIEDLRQRLDASEAARERQDARLTDMTVQALRPHKGGLWARLRGQGG